MPRFTTVLGPALQEQLVTVNDIMWMYISHRFPLLQYVTSVTICVCCLVGLSFRIGVARFVQRVHVERLPYGR
jgi:hypothetical protein